MQCDTAGVTTIALLVLCTGELKIAVTILKFEQCGSFSNASKRCRQNGNDANGMASRADPVIRLHLQKLCRAVFDTFSSQKYFSQVLPF